MTTKRTDDAILARIEEIRSDDVFGFEIGDLIEALSFEAAKPFLKDGVTSDEWEQSTDPVMRARDYLSFAWDKANNCRGISASRSVSHFKAWLWLAGVDDFSPLADAEYEYYGKPVLVIVSEALGIDWRALDDGDWRNSEGSEGLTINDGEAERLIALAMPIKAIIGEKR